MAISIPIIAEWKGGDAITKARKEFQQLEGAGAKANFAIKKAAIPAAAAFAGVGAALFDATKGAIEDAAAQDKLAKQIKRSTKATDAQIAANEDWISTQGKLLGIADDKLRPALSGLVRVTGDITKAQKAASLAMDVSAAKGVELETVTKALEKAYGGNYKAIGLIAPELRAMIKEGATLDEIMAKLSITFGGAATDAANTVQGKFQRLTLQLDETKESIGASLIPVVEAALPVLQKLADWAANNPETFKNIALAIGAVTAATVALNLAMAANPVVLAAAGFVALAVAFERLAQAADKLNKVGGIGLRLLGLFMKIPAIGLLEKGLAPFTKDKNKFEGLPTTRIPAMAEGGIVKSKPGGTLALIGEAGKSEAVIPLDKLGRMGGETNVQINVHGGDPNAVVDALRTYMRRNGSVPIKVSNLY